MCPFTTPLGRSLTKCLSELELAALGTFSVRFYSKYLFFSLQSFEILFYVSIYCVCICILLYLLQAVFNFLLSVL